MHNIICCSVAAYASKLWKAYNRVFNFSPSESSFIERHSFGQEKGQEICDSHGGEDVDVGLLGCNACEFVSEYQSFGGRYCFYLQG
jgi:hypothetical protein